MTFCLVHAVYSGNSVDVLVQQSSSQHLKSNSPQYTKSRPSIQQHSTEHSPSFPPILSSLCISPCLGYSSNHSSFCSICHPCHAVVLIDMVARQLTEYRSRARLLFIYLSVFLSRTKTTSPSCRHICFLRFKYTSLVSSSGLTFSGLQKT